MFRFSNHPALISVTEGIKDAWNFMAASWQRWIVVVLVVAAATAIISNASASLLDAVIYQDPFTGRISVVEGAGGKIGQYVALALLSAGVTLLASWYYYGLAISALRTRPITPGWLIGRGLRVLVSSLVVLVAFLAAFIAAAILVALLQGLGVLFVLVGFVVAVYVGLRLTLSGLAIFDGAGPIEGLEQSWALTRGAVLRVFGWGLMAVLLAIIFAVVGAIAGAFFPARSLLHEFISSVATSAATVLVTLMIAVLYESQRARMNPNLYPMPGIPYGQPPFGPGPGGYPPYPPYPPTGAYPQYPPPGAYPPGAYSPAAYPPAAYPPNAWPPAGAYPPPGAWPPPSQPPFGQPPFGQAPEQPALPAEPPASEPPASQS